MHHPGNLNFSAAICYSRVTLPSDVLKREAIIDLYKPTIYWGTAVKYQLRMLTDLLLGNQRVRRRARERTLPQAPSPKPCLTIELCRSIEDTKSLVMILVVDR